MLRSPARAAVLVFFLVGCFLFWSAASRFVLNNNDEGIYLDGARRVVAGQMPYRDFFALTGPGTFALISWALRGFGETLAAARLPVVFDLALMTAGVFWFVLRRSSRWLAAAIPALLFVAMATADHTLVLANHRWDSGAWAFLAMLLACCTGRSPVFAFSAGVAAGAASWCTPTTALAGIALFACLVFWSRRSALPFAGGVAAAFAAGLAWLGGAIGPMVDSLVWSAGNYAGPNRAFYGSVIGGYANLFKDAGPAEIAVTAIVLFFLTLPATLPIANLAWIAARPALDVRLVLAGGLALVAASFPRPDLIHLLYVSAPFYALAGAWLAERLRGRAALALCAAVLIVAAANLGIAIQRRLAEPQAVTRVGRVHAQAPDLAVLRMTTPVAPGDSLFVFPYWPLFYFTSGARNPTRYSFLQPGMFPASDESAALEQLRRDPPRWVVYIDVAPESYLRIWPASDRSRLRMPRLEEWIRSNYREQAREADFRLLLRGVSESTPGK